MNNMFKLRYSQNFLQSNKTINKIISLSNINREDTVYEIGAGKGIITKQLSEKSNNVIAIELDNNLYVHLTMRFENTDNVKIIKADFLDLHLPRRYPYKVFSNIPFNITTAIIKKLTNINDCPTDSYLIVQKEPALKYLGKYGTTREALLLKPFFNLEIVYEFQRFDFKPVPNVEAVLIHIKLNNQPLIERKHFNKYQRFIMHIFSKKNYPVKEVLKDFLTHKQIKRLGQNHKFNINGSIYSVEMNQWIEIFNFFINNASNNKSFIYVNNSRKLNKIYKRNKRNH